MSITLIAVMLIGILSPVAAGIDPPTGSIVGRLFGVTEASADDTYTVTFDAGEGSFTSGETENVVEYGSITTGTATKYSHTPSVDDFGTQCGNYGNNLAINDVVRIPNASSLTVVITYGGYSQTADWACVWEGNHPEYTAQNDYAESVSGRLGGGNHANSTNTKTYVISGDTVTFGFYSDGDFNYGDGYGYYAVITGAGDTQEIMSGEYEQPMPNDSTCGNHFASWNTALDGSGDTFRLGDEVSSDITVYAQYESGIVWKTADTCEWGLDVDKCMWVRPIDGVSGTLPSSYQSPWYSARYSIKSAIIMPGVIAKNCYSMFAGCSALKSVDLSNLSLSNSVYAADEMFQGCTQLVSVDLSVVDMSCISGVRAMFKDCSALESVNLGNIGTISIANASEMFCGCSSLTSVDVSNLNTSNATSTASMFKNCSQLTNIDVSNFSTGNVTDMSSMFYGCSGVTNLDVSHFVTNNVTNMTCMFGGCSSLTSLDVSGFNTSNVTNMGSMFSGCEKLTSLDVSNFNTSKVTKMNSMFRGCSQITNLDLSNFDTRLVTSMESMFRECKKLTSVGAGLQYALNINGFDTSNATNLSYMFSDCTKLEIIDVGSLNTNKNVYLADMFSHCSSVVNLDLRDFYMPNATNLFNMFAYCTNLETLDIRNLNTQNATSLGYIFSYNPKLERIHIGENFKFKGKNITYIYSQAIFPAMGNPWETGKWYLEGDTSGTMLMTPADIRDNYDGTTMAGVWVKEIKTPNDDDGVSSWNTCGGCEWGVDSNYWMWIRPINGVEGTLENWDRYGSAPWSSWAASVKAVVIEPGVSAATCQNMFKGFSNCSWMDLADLDTSNVTNMSGMFSGCTNNLKELDLSSFDTSSATDMSSMFSNCKVLEDIDLSSFNTSNVTNMQGMFSCCQKLKSLNISSFNTSNVTTMQGMFSACSALKSVDVSGFNTGNVIDMTSMFSECKALTSLDVTNFDTSNVTTMYGMFQSCEKIQSLDLSNFRTDNVTSMMLMFKGCKLLETLDISHFNTEKVTTMASMFSSCEVLTSLDVSDFDTSLVTTMYYMFYNCKALTELDVSGFETGNVTTMEDMFANCENITSLDVSNFDTSKVESFLSMFYGCKSVRELDVSGFDTHLASNFTTMFYNCNNLTELDVSNFNTSNATRMNSMFSGCARIESLDVSGFDTSNVTIIGSMFSGCQALSSVDVSGFNTSNVTSLTSMFQNCRSLTSIDLSNWNTSNVVSMDQMFRYCESLSELDISNFSTVKTNNLGNMFSDSPNLRKISIGENFSFKGIATAISKQALPPEPPTGLTTGYWIIDGDDAGTTAMTNTEMRQAGNVEPGTWVWQLKANTAVVNFSGNGGVVNGTTQHTQTDIFTPITFPEAARPEYMLTGWNTKADGTGTAYPAEGSITPTGGQNITLYAQWALDTRVNYLVKHYKQSAGVEPVFPDDYTLADTESLKAEPGTSVTPDVMTYPYFTAPETQTVEVASDGSTVVNYLYNYAITTINFYGNGNDSGMMRTQDYAWARGDKLNKNLFSKTGHIFTGWNTAADGSGVSFSDRGLVPNAPSNPLNLFAQWQEISVQTADDTTGLFTVTLHAGEYARISGLPAGSTYEIVEVNIPNGWQLTNEEGTTGKIVSNDIKEASFLNTYSASGEGDIQAHKLLNNGILSSGQFSFGLRKVGESEPLQIKTNGAVDNNATIIDQDTGEELPNPNYGLGDITFDPIEYTAEGVYQYEIYEIAPSPGDPDYDIGVQYDTSILPVTVTVTDAGGGKLSANVAYPNGDRFVNSILPGSLHLIEALVESYTTDIEGHPQPGELIRDDDHIFTVTVHFTDDAGNPVPGEFPVRYVDENGNTTNGTISDGDVINIHTFKDALITELPDGTQYSAVMRHDNGYEYYTAYEVEGTIVAGETKNGEFYIVPMPPEIVTTSITVKKTVRGNLSDVNKDFEFTLHLEDEQGNPYTGVVRFTGKEAGSEDLDGNGNMTFTLKHNEEISFIGLPVGIRYSVTERDYTADGYQTNSTNDSGITTAAPIQVDFINTNSAMVPTGINLQMASGITLVALAMLGVGIYVSKHKKSKKAEHTAE